MKNFLKGTLSKLKVLVILCNDVYNFSTVNIVREMIKRGFKLEFYSTRMERQHVRMFEEMGLEIKDFASISPEIVKEFDFIYTAATFNILPISWWKTEKYFFHFTTTPYDEPGGYGDYTFTQRDMNLYLIDDDHSIEKIKAFKASPGMVSGNPKYDFDSDTVFENKKQILYVDASHSPDCLEGRMEETRMLIDIAKSFPEYTLIIKPRYFKSDTYIVHPNRVFLCDCIQKIVGDSMPGNLKMLIEHADLEKIAKESEIIITSGNTSSYCSIGAYGKRGLIATDMPMKYPMWEYHSKLFRQISYKSGLAVPYNEVVDHLPQARSYDEKNLKDMGLHIHDASRRIVDEMERIYNEFISRGKYPSSSRDEEYISMDDVIAMRFSKSLFLFAEELKRDIVGGDFSEVDDYVIDLVNKKSRIRIEDYHSYYNEVMRLARKTIIENYHGVNATFLEQERYIRAMYDEGQTEKILNMQFDAKEMYLYVIGRYEIDNNHNYINAAKCFDEFRQMVMNPVYEKSYAYRPYYIESSSYWLGYCFYKLQEYEKARDCFLYCEQLTHNNHGKAKEYLKKIDGLMERQGN